MSDRPCLLMCFKYVYIYREQAESELCFWQLPHRNTRSPRWTAHCYVSWTKQLAWQLGIINNSSRICSFTFAHIPANIVASHLPDMLSADICRKLDSVGSILIFVFQCLMSLFRWRTKQNLDYSFLMMYAVSKGVYYVQVCLWILIQIFNDLYLSASIWS